LSGRKWSLLMARTMTTLFTLGFIWYEFMDAANKSTSERESRIGVVAFSFGVYTVFVTVAPWMVYRNTRLLEYFENIMFLFAFRASNLLAEAKVQNKSVLEVEAQVQDEHLYETKTTRMNLLESDEVEAWKTIVDSIKEPRDFGCCPSLNPCLDTLCFCFVSEAKVVERADNFVDMVSKYNVAVESNNEQLSRTMQKQIENSYSMDISSQKPVDFKKLNMTKKFEFYLRYLEVKRYMTVFEYDVIFELVMCIIKWCCLGTFIAFQTA
jgi:hypothetical protein